MLAPVKRSSLRTHLTSQLFDAILRGELRPGERIVEGKLARELGVAQSTLREALQQLEYQGLVTKSDRPTRRQAYPRSEEHTSELQSRLHLVCRLPLEKKTLEDVR